MPGVMPGSIKANLITSLNYKDMDGIYNTWLAGKIGAIEYYCYLYKECFLPFGKIFSDTQVTHIQELRDTVCTFGEIGLNWAKMANKLLINNNCFDENSKYYV